MPREKSWREEVRNKKKLRGDFFSFLAANCLEKAQKTTMLPTG